MIEGYYIYYYDNASYVLYVCNKLINDVHHATWSVSGKRMKIIGSDTYI
jgi:hypothetical protein